MIYFLSVTRCILQTVVGGIVALALLPKLRVRAYRGMIVLYHSYSFTFSLGTFAVISERSLEPRTVTPKQYGFFCRSWAVPFASWWFLCRSSSSAFLVSKNIAQSAALPPTDLFADRQAAYLEARLDG